MAYKERLMFTLWCKKECYICIKILKLPKLGYKVINKFFTSMITLFSTTFRYTFDNNFLLNMIKCFLCQAWKLIVSFYFEEMESKQKWQINLSKRITTSKKVCFLLSFTIWSVMCLQHENICVSGLCLIRTKLINVSNREHL